MFARLTLLEIDTVRVDMESAVELFRREVLPELKKQPGYLGVLGLSTPYGAGALVSFWETAEAAEAGGVSGFYPEVLERYMTIFKSPPGRERYEVAFADLPMTAPT
jgi:heme-degrading monooxygenase HmoA